MPTKDRKGTQLLFKTKNGEYQLIPQPEAISLDAENVSDDNFSDYFKDMEISFEINEEESKRLTSFLWKYFNYYEFLKKNILYNNWRKMHQLPLIRRRGKRK